MTLALWGGEGAAAIPFKAKPLELSFPWSDPPVEPIFSLTHRKPPSGRPVLWERSGRAFCAARWPKLSITSRALVQASANHRYRYHHHPCCSHFILPVLLLPLLILALTPRARTKHPHSANAFTAAHTHAKLPWHIMIDSSVYLGYWAEGPRRNVKKHTKKEKKVNGCGI